MGRVTRTTGLFTQTIIDRYQRERQDAEEDGFSHDGWMDTVWGHVQASHVFGIMAMRKLGSEQFRIEVINSQKGLHAEFCVRETLSDLFPDGAPYAAKIIIFLKRSPCRECTRTLYDEYADIYQNWANNKTVYFKITFNQYYLTGAGSWGSIAAAQAAYAEVNASSDLVRRPSKNDLVPLLTIAQAQALRRH
jgi:hypothetical protein